MKITAIHIENFGKLSSVDIDIQDGLNTFLEHNGWGKSTLAAFIKVMLYGFDNEKKQDDVINERKRFKPWQGGAYGGSLSFEARDKQYTVTRIFGNKEADDTFELRDKATGLISEDYDSFLGEALFNIDSESFKRTVFISESDCMCSVSDSISAKMGNLVDNTDDINSFEAVDSNIAAMLNALGPKRKGRLKTLQDDIADLQVKIKSLSGLDETADEIMAKKAMDKKEYEQQKRQQADITKIQKKYASYKDKQALKQQYEKLYEDYNQRTKVFNQAEDALGQVVPEAVLLDEYSKKSIALNNKKIQLSASTNGEMARLEKLDKCFSNGMPDYADITDLLDKWSECGEIKRTLSRREARLDTLTALHEKDVSDGIKSVNQGAMLFIIIGILFMAAGVALTIFMMIPGIITLAVGALLLLIGIIKKAGNKNYNIPESEELIDLRESVDLDYDYLESVYKETEKYLATYSIPFNEESAVKALMELREDSASYNDLKQQGNQICKLRKEVDELEEDIADYMASLKLESTKNEDIPEVLSQLKEKLIIYESAQKEWNEAKRAKEAFEKAHSEYEELKNLEAPLEDVSLSDNENRLASISEEVERLHKNIMSYDRQLDDLNMKRDELGEYERSLEALLDEKEEVLKEYNILSMTRDYLTRAKQSFVNKYTKPVKDSFDKYYKMLTGMEGSDYTLDADMKLYSVEHGLPRTVSHLSLGYQNLVGICMRMALIDAMYKEEKPFVIFDDPFVNLDDEKAKCAKEFLKIIASEHQIIYFTCHGRL